METVIFAALAEQTWQADPKRMTVMTDQFAGRGNNCQGNWSLTPTGMTRRKRLGRFGKVPGQVEIVRGLPTLQAVWVLMPVTVRRGLILLDGTDLLTDRVSGDVMPVQCQCVGK